MGTIWLHYYPVQHPGSVMVWDLVKLISTSVMAALMQKNTHICSRNMHYVSTRQFCEHYEANVSFHDWILLISLILEWQPVYRTIPTPWPHTHTPFPQCCTWADWQPVGGRLLVSSDRVTLADAARCATAAGFHSCVGTEARPESSNNFLWFSGLWRPTAVWKTFFLEGWG